MERLQPLSDLGWAVAEHGIDAHAVPVARLAAAARELGVAGAEARIVTDGGLAAVVRERAFGRLAEAVARCSRRGLEPVPPAEQHVEAA